MIRNTQSVIEKEVDLDIIVLLYFPIVKSLICTEHRIDKDMLLTMVYDRYIGPFI